MDKMSKQTVGEYWTKVAKKKFIGRKIIGVRYMTEKEADASGWDNSSVVLFLDDGSHLFPSMDDEGNNAGALFGATSDDKNFTLPAISSGILNKKMGR